MLSEVSATTHLFVNLKFIMIMQTSTSVQRTTEVVAMEPSAETPLEALSVLRSVAQDTRVMEQIVWVSQIIMSVIFVCPLHDS